MLAGCGVLRVLLAPNRPPSRLRPLAPQLSNNQCSDQLWRMATEIMEINKHR